ncbi:MAG: type I-C CRISPR-associated protein Cas5c [Victivallaceae bacterium]|nr:type I-C CRISPR-associated protein Cas5c [Victivallaceae bacterium]MDD4180270.1 type I-C CRISPR-associated protein Cas5c [Victivallaceae bacterium]
MENTVNFKVYGRYALFADPLSKIGGDKCSYQIPTYEAIKGIARSIYWKPTFIWVIDRIRIMNRIRTESKNIKVPKMTGGNTLAIYNYLADVEYQVEAHFEWNMFRDDSYAEDRIEGKHYEIAKRMIAKGGRRDVFLGARECQAYVKPCIFGEGTGEYDNDGDLIFGMMFHGFDYPEENGKNELVSRFWRPKICNGIIEFPRPEDCEIRKTVREMNPEPLKSVGLKEEALANELD